MAKRKFSYLKATISFAAVVISWPSWGADIQEARDKLKKINVCISKEELVPIINDAELYIVMRGDLPLNEGDGSKISRTVFLTALDWSFGYIFSHDDTGNYCKKAYITDINLLDNRTDKLDGSVRIGSKNGGNINSLVRHITTDLEKRQLPMMQFWLEYEGSPEIVTVVGKSGANGAMIFAGSDGIVRRRWKLNSPLYITAGKQLLDARPSNFMSDAAWRTHVKKLVDYDTKKVNIGAGESMTAAQIDRTIDYLSSPEGKKKFMEEFKKKMSKN